MCNNESPPPSKEPLAVSFSIGNSMAGFLPGLEQYRLQLYHYAMAERIRVAQHLHPQHQQHTLGQQTAAVVGQQGSSHLGIGHSYPAPLPLYPTGAGYTRGLALSMALLHPHHQHIPEEPKPQHSYIGLIAMAILSSPEKKLVLSDIYQHILEHYPYFRRRGPGWRNSIRHNLSLNDCFVKSGRSANGKGHYWAIHPANLEDFRRGDFRRRKAQRKVRRHMGLAVEEEPDSPSPPPLPSSPAHASSLPPSLVSHSIPALWTQQQQNQQQQQQQNEQQQHIQQVSQDFIAQTSRHTSLQPSRKRQFDVASLLAPDDQHNETSLYPRKSSRFSYSDDEHEQDHEQENRQNEEDIDVEVDVEAETQSKPMNSDYSWRNPMLIETGDQAFSSVNLSNQVLFKNYYVPTNTRTGSSI